MKILSANSFNLVEFIVLFSDVESILKPSDMLFIRLVQFERTV